MKRKKSNDFLIVGLEKDQGFQKFLVQISFTTNLGQFLYVEEIYWTLSLKPVIGMNFKSLIT